MRDLSKVWPVVGHHYQCGFSVVTSLVPLEEGVGSPGWKLTMRGLSVLYLPTCFKNLSLFLRFIYLFYVCEYTIILLIHQKGASDPITNGCEPHLNSGPLKEQTVLLTTEPSLHLICWLLRNQILQ